MPLKITAVEMNTIVTESCDTHIDWIKIEDMIRQSAANGRNGVSISLLMFSEKLRDAISEKIIVELTKKGFESKRNTHISGTNGQDWDDLIVTW